MQPRAIRTHREVTRDLELSADVVIVGAGAGGSAAAARLAEAGKRVVILEGGSYLEFTEYPRKSSTSYGALFFEDGQLAAAAPGGTMIPLAAGKGVGGSTLINSAMCFRGPSHRLEEWADFVGNDRYGPDRMARLYEEVEATIHVAPTSDDPEILGTNNRKTLDGLRALGYEGGLVNRSTPGCVGCGVCFLGCPVGGKGSTDRNWLGARAFNHDCTVYANTWVKEILVEGGRAVGVRGRVEDPDTKLRGAWITVRAPRVILAGGAIGTAKVLLQTDVSDNRHIGRHLRVHPTGVAFAYFEDEVRMWRGATQGCYGHHADHPDILIESFTVGTEVLFAQAAMPGVDGKTFFETVQQMAGTGFLLREESEGYVSLADRGKAAIGYHLLPSDLVKMRQGLRMAAEVMLAAGALSVRPGVWFIGYCETMAEVNEALSDLHDANDIYSYGSHLQGTCRMASRPEDGVVDSRGRVFDVPGLYVADSSVFPAALGRNPQMTVMAFALNIAEQMLEDW